MKKIYFKLLLSMMILLSLSFLPTFYESVSADTGGIGKISGVVVGVLIFTALTYSLTILGIDTNLQFVFEGIIILVAVTLDCLKYVQKK